jgi:hypothetical protein
MAAEPRPEPAADMVAEGRGPVDRQRPGSDPDQPHQRDIELAQNALTARRPFRQSMKGVANE